ncbi:hypothetical protein TNCV_1786141 [Trichonephila clavipes]|nr:hypothetical protein TNCV_1786141 [Trichonephila clavipes]
MLAKKSSGYRQVPLADIGSPIQIVLSTPDDSECEEDTFDKVSDITIESGNSLSLQVAVEMSDEKIPQYLGMHLYIGMVLSYPQKEADLLAV